ncbi:MAG: hypothetical protein JJT94_04605 [Bernardetiaceae bacterium]|nr:hypothetical protein [Bernardetiaceae bacterium]
MDFKYKEHHKRLEVECPPKNYKSFRINAYRWVFEAGDERNFQTQYEKFMKRFPNPSKPPKRYNDISDLKKRGKKMCEDMAYSMYITAEEAEHSFIFLSERFPKAEFGKHIAFAEITEKDGVNSEIDNNGHFNHHPFEPVDYENRFQIIASFIKL